VLLNVSHLKALKKMPFEVISQGAEIKETKIG